MPRKIIRKKSLGSINAPKRMPLTGLKTGMPARSGGFRPTTNKARRVLGGGVSKRNLGAITTPKGMPLTGLKTGMPARMPAEKATRQRAVTSMSPVRKKSTRLNSRLDTMKIKRMKKI